MTAVPPPPPGPPGHHGQPYPGQPYPGQPYQGQPYPGYAQPVPVPARKRSLKPLFITLGVVFVVCCVGGSGAGIWGVNKFFGALRSVRSAATQYLDALRDSQFPLAYDLLCARSRNAVTPARFEQEAPRFTSYSITNTSVRNDNGVKSATVTAILSTNDPAHGEEQVLPLVKQADQWRVCPY
jgi:hypothetical protein